MKRTIYILVAAAVLVSATRAAAWQDERIYPLKSGAGGDPAQDAALRLFDPGNVPPAEGGLGAWRGCMDADRDLHPVASKDGQLLEECLPDTLYTWGPAQKLESLRKEAPPSSSRWSDSFEKAVFTHINPSATFGYGEMTFRIKLKPGTRFLRMSYAGCDKLTHAQLKDTVIVNFWSSGYGEGGVVHWKSGVDYILCGPGPIQSWSYGTKEHYDEIVRSLLWLKNGRQDSDWLPYTRQNGKGELFDSGADRLDWSRARLFANLARMRRIIEEKRGSISFAPGVSPDTAGHYTTGKPVYWNRNGRAGAFAR